MREEMDFSAIRNLPAELNRQEVENIIGNLPALSAGVAWGKLFNFKSIIMSSFLIGAIVCGTLFWPTTDVTQDRLAYMPTLSTFGFTAPQPQPASANSALYTLKQDADSLPKKKSALLGSGEETEKKSTEKNILDNAVKPQEELLSDNPDMKIKVDGLFPQIGDGINAPQDIMALSDLDGPKFSGSRLGGEPIALPENDFCLGTESDSAFADCSGYNCDQARNVVFGCGDHEGELLVVRIGKLKRSLRRLVFEDKIIQDKDDAICVKYKSDQILINNVLIPVHNKKKYIALFKKHKVKPGENKQIQITDLFVAVGNFEGNDFRGSGRGCFMHWKTQDEVLASPDRITSWE